MLIRPRASGSSSTLGQRSDLCCLADRQDQASPICCAGRWCSFSYGCSLRNELAKLALAYSAKTIRFYTDGKSSKFEMSFRPGSERYGGRRKTRLRAEGRIRRRLNHAAKLR